MFARIARMTVCAVTAALLADCAGVDGLAPQASLRARQLAVSTDLIRAPGGGFDAPDRVAAMEQQ